MLIACPYCGPLGNEEFVYRGDANVQRPPLGAAVADASSTAWMNYVYWRDNPAGLHRELWYHATGCRAWLIVTRNVSTHEIIAIELAKNAAAGA
jgi:sarcosine oxidase subunit delta